MREHVKIKVRRTIGHRVMDTGGTGEMVADPHSAKLTTRGITLGSGMTVVSRDVTYGTKQR